MRIGSGSHWIEFEREPNGGEYLSVRLATGTAVAETRVAFFATDFAGFLESLAKDWKGWTGAKNFKTLDSDLAITATHNGAGQIFLGIELRSYTDGWRLNASLPIEPGQLDEMAEEAKTTFAGIPKTPN